MLVYDTFYRVGLQLHFFLVFRVATNAYRDREQLFVLAVKVIQKHFNVINVHLYLRRKYRHIVARL